MGDRVLVASRSDRTRYVREFMVQYHNRQLYNVVISHNE